jgi:hypothetical protein
LTKTGNPFINIKMAKRVTKKDTLNETVEPDNKESKLICGIIMPISSIDTCPAEHWKEVLDILKDAISAADFSARLVSESDDSGIIQKTIIQNLYSDPIVVCDVSGKNPNVMFELGMRLAFDKPTIVVKDDKTDYSFDTSPIEHVLYRRDLRFSSIVDFKDALTEKVKGTHNQATENKDYTTFLKHFGKFTVAGLEEQVVDKDDYLLKSIEDLREEIRRIPRTKTIRELPYEHGRIDGYYLVRNKVEKYLKIRNISTINKNDEGLRETLFRYLQGFTDIRDSCGSSTRLRATVNLVLRDI